MEECHDVEGRATCPEDEMYDDLLHQVGILFFIKFLGVW
jgi:hypothetical protein